MEENITKPTIGTLLERMNGMEERLGVRLDGLVNGFEGLGVRLDRIESVANITRGEMLELRADFRELRRQLKDQFPALR